MSAEQVIEDAFLAVSCLSLIVQLWGLTRLAHRAGTAAARGLFRTSVCRVGCAVLYVYVGLNALVFHCAVLTTTFAVFCVVQATWQINAWADVRLRKRLDGGTT